MNMYGTSTLFAVGCGAAVIFLAILPIENKANKKFYSLGVLYRLESLRGANTFHFSAMICGDRRI